MSEDKKYLELLRKMLRVARPREKDKIKKEIERVRHRILKKDIRRHVTKRNLLPWEG